jgi:hypothetical protein
MIGRVAPILVRDRSTPGITSANALGVLTFRRIQIVASPSGTKFVQNPVVAAPSRLIGLTCNPSVTKMRTSRLCTAVMLTK